MWLLYSSWFVEVLLTALCCLLYSFIVVVVERSHTILIIFLWKCDLFIYIHEFLWDEKEEKGKKKTEKQTLEIIYFSSCSLSFHFPPRFFEYDVTNYLFFICPFIYASNEWMFDSAIHAILKLCHVVWWSERNVEEWWMFWDNKRYLNDSSIFSIFAPPILPLLYFMLHTFMLSLYFDFFRVLLWL